MPLSGPNQNAEEREKEMENLFGKKKKYRKYGSIKVVN